MTLVCAIASGKRSDSSSLQALEIRAGFLKIAGILNQALDGSGCEDIAELAEFPKLLDISGNFWLSGAENNPALQGKDMADTVTDPALENQGMFTLHSLVCYRKLKVIQTCQKQHSFIPTKVYQDDCHRGER
jgi:hypothetical protein